MCYHTSTPATNKIKEQLPGYLLKYDPDTYYHVSGFSRPFLPTTLNTDQTSIVASQWKLLPFWVRNNDEAKKYANTLNAESESIFEKGSYKGYIQKYRGLLWVDGFYEPHKNKITGQSENYYIYTPEKKIFSLGIVVAPWLDTETGEFINTFSVITTKANPLLEEIHNEKKRMPLIIPEHDRDGWLNARDKEEINEFFVPYQHELQSHKVYRVTADRTGETNRADIQDRIE